MTDKKLTDEQIIKAYEVCYLEGDGCSSCPCCDENGFCKDDERNTVLHEIRNIINRQKAEVERLRSMNQAKLDTIHDLMAEVERLKQPILMAENVDINKEELIEKLQQSQIQPIPIEKHYELRDCPFSPFDEYCTGHCVNCENRLECVDCSRRLKVKAYKEVIERLKEHLCNYDLPDYHSFKAVDEDTIDEVLKELVGESA